MKSVRPRPCDEFYVVSCESGNERAYHLPPRSFEDITPRQSSVRFVEPPFVEVRAGSNSWFEMKKFSYASFPLPGTPQNSAVSNNVKIRLEGTGSDSKAKLQSVSELPVAAVDPRGLKIECKDLEEVAGVFVASALRSALTGFVGDAATQMIPVDMREFLSKPEAAAGLTPSELELCTFIITGDDGPQEPMRAPSVAARTILGDEDHDVELNSDDDYEEGVDDFFRKSRKRVSQSFPICDDTL